MARAALPDDDSGESKPTIDDSDRYLRKRWSKDGIGKKWWLTRRRFTTTVINSQSQFRPTGWWICLSDCGVFHVAKGQFPKMSGKAQQLTVGLRMTVMRKSALTDLLDKVSLVHMGYRVRVSGHPANQRRETGHVQQPCWVEGSDRHSVYRVQLAALPSVSNSQRPDGSPDGNCGKGVPTIRTLSAQPEDEHMEEHFEVIASKFEKRPSLSSISRKSVSSPATSTPQQGNVLGGFSTNPGPRRCFRHPEESRVGRGLDQTCLTSSHGRPTRRAYSSTIRDAATRQEARIRVQFH